MLLKAKPVVQHLNTETQTYIDQNNLRGKTVVFFLLNETKASDVYVSLKMKQAEKLGLSTERRQAPNIALQDLMVQIQECNENGDVIGVVVQLPLPSHLQEHQAVIMSAIQPKKDIDGLGGTIFGLSSIGLVDFLPATPKAVIELLKYYGYDQFRGKTVMIIGQSNLTGKPLAAECMKQGATVLSFNERSDKKMLRDAFSQADIVVSATGAVHLIDDGYVSLCEENPGKVLVDVGRGIKDDKAVGDIDWETLEGVVGGITPVPGGIGPVTVACIFHNIKSIGESVL